MQPFHLSTSLNKFGQGIINFRCPACHQRGSFEKAQGDMLDLRDSETGLFFGSRVCPNLNCRAHVFLVRNSQGGIEAAYPPEGIDFDDNDIPEGIATTFEEALLCHRVGADTAAAIMVRRTLEELCSDQGATGDNLKDRIKALAGVVTLPPALLDGADVLRLLGNDAAHLERKVFKEVGPDQLNAAIIFTKELLKAVYQYQSLLGQLESLKGDTDA